MKPNNISSIHDLLSSTVDPNSQEFWRIFKDSLKVVKDKHLTRPGIMNLKLLLKDSANKPVELESICKFVQKSPIGIGNSITLELCELINSHCYSWESSIKKHIANELFKSATILSRANDDVCSIMRDMTFPQFADKLLSCPQIPSDILTSLFRFELVLANKKPNQDNNIYTTLTSVHFKNAVLLLQKCGDSVAQAMIIEWLYRLKYLFESSIFGIHSTLFDNLNLSNSSIHSFIRSINSESNTIHHIPFTSITITGKTYQFQGFIDMNSNTLAIWNLEKPKSSNLSDIIVYRLSSLSNVRFSEKQLHFSVKSDEYSFTTPYKAPLVLVRRCNGSRRKIGEQIQPEPMQKRIYALKKADIPLADGEKAEGAAAQLDSFCLHLGDRFCRFYDSVNSEIGTMQTLAAEAKRSLLSLKEQHNAVTEKTTNANNEIEKRLDEMKKTFVDSLKETEEKRMETMKKLQDNIEREKSTALTEMGKIFGNNAIINVTNAMLKQPVI